MCLYFRWVNGGEFSTYCQLLDVERRETLQKSVYVPSKSDRPKIIRTLAELRWCVRMRFRMGRLTDFNQICAEWLGTSEQKDPTHKIYSFLNSVVGSGGVNTTKSH